MRQPITHKTQNPRLVMSRGLLLGAQIGIYVLEIFRIQSLGTFRADTIRCIPVCPIEVAVYPFPCIVSQSETIAANRHQFSRSHLPTLGTYFVFYPPVWLCEEEEPWQFFFLPLIAYFESEAICTGYHGFTPWYAMPSILVCISFKRYSCRCS